MSRLAYCALHYGKEYLAWALASVQDAVDEIHVLYTDKPSYGHATTLPCPDTEEELYAEAKRFTLIPIVWHRGQWSSEADHRNAIYKIADHVGASQVLVVDSDEIWQPGAAEEALRMGEGCRAYFGAGGVNMVHFWRSLKWVNKDHWMPMRVLNIGTDPNNQGFLNGLNPVLHCGYAQSVSLMTYKWSCHGHQAELRPGWLERFKNWLPGEKDVHPTTNNIWNPVLRDFPISPLYDHPNINKEIIE